MIADLTALIQEFGEPTVVGANLVFNYIDDEKKLRIMSSGGENILVLPKDGYQGQVFVDFRSSQSCVFIGSDKARVRILCGFGCVISISPGTTFTTLAKFILAEETNIFVGADCMFAENVTVSNTDGHPIFDFDGNRINLGRDIVIGNSVWLGRGCDIMKGSNIGCGAIIGARSVVTGKIDQYSIAAGIPAKVIRKDVTFDRVTTTRRQFVSSKRPDTKVTQHPNRVQDDKFASLALSAYPRNRKSCG
jgi:acetyltransferase-like isoleucine patch superfamily enzyme